MTLFATDPDPASLGLFIQNVCYLSVAVLSVIGAVCTVYATFFKKPSTVIDPGPKGEAATRGEVADTTAQVKADLMTLISAVKGELFSAISSIKNDATVSVASIKTDLTREVTRLDQDIKELRVKFHEHNNKLHVINLRLVRIDTMVAQGNAHAGISVPPEIQVSPPDEP